MADATPIEGAHLHPEPGRPVYAVTVAGADVYRTLDIDDMRVEWRRVYDLRTAGTPLPRQECRHAPISDHSPDQLASLVGSWWKVFPGGAIGCLNPLFTRRVQLLYPDEELQRLRLAGKCLTPGCGRPGKKVGRPFTLDHGEAESLGIDKVLTHQPVCDACDAVRNREYHRNHKRAIRAALDSETCPGCMIRPRRPGKTKCLECAGRDNKAMARLTAERDQNGVCTRCGEARDAGDGPGKWCGGCRAARAAWKKSRRRPTTSTNS